MPLCTCALHTQISSARRVDPTQTITLRKRYERAIVRRIINLRKKIAPAVTDLLGSVAVANARQRYTFPTDAGKVPAFRRWLDRMVDENILEVVSRDGATITGRRNWQDVFVRSAYQKGLSDAYGRLAETGYVNPLDISGRAMAPSASMFNVPIHARTLESLFTRNFEDLRGITDAMSSRISRALTQGLAEGRSPLRIASILRKEVDGVGIRRARVLARTEIIRAHAEATLNSYQQAGVEGVDVMAEWLTAGDGKVCSVCASLSGRVYTIAEAKGMLPRHPNCRCAWIPAEKQNS